MYCNKSFRVFRLQHSKLWLEPSTPACRPSRRRRLPWMTSTLCPRWEPTQWVSDTRFQASQHHILEVQNKSESSSFFPLHSRLPKLGARTKWTNPNTKSTPRWTPSRQAQRPWSTWLQVETVPRNGFHFHTGLYDETDKKLLKYVSVPLIVDLCFFYGSKLNILDIYTMNRTVYSQEQ